VGGGGGWPALGPTMMKTTVKKRALFHDPVPHHDPGCSGKRPAQKKKRNVWPQQRGKFTGGGLLFTSRRWGKGTQLGPYFIFFRAPFPGGKNLFSIGGDGTAVHVWDIQIKGGPRPERTFFFNIKTSPDGPNYYGLWGGLISGYLKKNQVWAEMERTLGTIGARGKKKKTPWQILPGLKGVPFCHRERNRKLGVFVAPGGTKLLMVGGGTIGQKKKKKPSQRFWGGPGLKKKKGPLAWPRFGPMAHQKWGTSWGGQKRGAPGGRGAGFGFFFFDKKKKKNQRFSPPQRRGGDQADF